MVDEQFFTGESWPVPKSEGSGLLGGTLNLDGDLVLEATALPQQGALGRLVESVRNAQSAKGRYELLADRCARFFFPLIGLIAIGTAIWHGQHSGIEAAILHPLAVVLIACPCALALATPLAVWAALGTTARKGVLLRGRRSPRASGRSDRAATRQDGDTDHGLPVGRPLLVRRPAQRDEVLSRAAALTGSSTHLFSRAIRGFVETTQLIPALSSVRAIPGRGIVARLEGEDTDTLLGSRRLMTEQQWTVGPRLGEALQNLDLTSESCVLLGWDGEVRGLFQLREQLRLEAPELITACRELGLDIEVLTGDHAARGARLQQEIGIPVRAEMLPEDKLQAIKSLRQRGVHVAMVGDGINDAPALALADVGIAMGCGTDVTRETSDVCLIRDDLRAIPWAIRHARRTIATIRQNLFWSFAYNGVGVILAAAGWLHPAIAAALMVISSLMVLGNSLRLKDAGDPRVEDESSVPAVEPSTPPALPEVVR